MKFTDETKRLFIKDIPFYKNSDCYCLGSTLEEAGEIANIFLQNIRGEKNVGMDFLPVK